MKKSKLLLYACAGSLVTVLIWSVVGSSHSNAQKSMLPAQEEEISLPESSPITESIVETAETEEMMIEEGIIEGKKVATLKPSDSSEKVVLPVSSEEKGERIHVIDKGDTLWAISRTYGVSVSAIQEANGIKDAGCLSIGQKLKIPEA